MRIIIVRVKRNDKREGAAMKLIRKEAGRYFTADGRFEVRNTYDGSGASWVRYAASPRWLVMDRVSDKNVRKFQTLSDVRNWLNGR